MHVRVHFHIYRSNFVYMVNHGLGDRLVVSNTDSDIRQLPISSMAGHTSSLSTTDTPTSVDLPTTSNSDSKSSAGTWKLASGEEERWGLRLTIEHEKVKCLSLSLFFSLSPFLSCDKVMHFSITLISFYFYLTVLCPLSAS